MSAIKEKQKLIVIEWDGTIGELGGISGPVLNPTLQPMSVIIKMVYNRKNVYEVNPNDYSDRVLLNLRNVREDNFPAAKEEVKAHINIAVPDKKPVVEEKKESTNIKDAFKESKKESVESDKSDFTKK